MFSSGPTGMALHKSRIKKLVKLTSHLAGTFIAICHSSDYTPGAAYRGLIV
jgi:hypothetical protein